MLLRCTRKLISSQQPQRCAAEQAKLPAVVRVPETAGRQSKPRQAQPPLALGVPLYLPNMIRAPTPCPCPLLQDNDGASRRFLGKAPVAKSTWIQYKLPLHLSQHNQLPRNSNQHEGACLSTARHRSLFKRINEGSQTGYQFRCFLLFIERHQLLGQQQHSQLSTDAESQHKTRTRQYAALPRRVG